MSASLHAPWTLQQFLSWAADRDGRYEFDGAQPVAVTGATVNHALIMRDLHLALGLRLRGGPCRPLGPDAGLATAGSALRYPDALVTCSLPDGESLTVGGVIVVFEILSAGTSRTDRIVKLREYAAVASIRRYVIIESTSVGLTVMQRDSPAQPWTVTTLTGTDTLELPEIGIAIPIAEFYESVELPPI